MEGELGKLFLLIISVSQCEPLPDWNEFPLTARDVSLVQLGGNVPITTNSNNQTCLLTPLDQKTEDLRCTWRSEEECVRIPSIIKIPVYSPWCEEQRNGGHLLNCKETISSVPIVHSVHVCTPSGTPDCRGPCYNCDKYCETAKQSWCEKSHSISTLVSEKRECREEAGDDCEEVLKRVEKDVVETTDNCYQKDVDLCAPVNCKFVNITKECHEKNSTMVVELRERECTVCEPTLAERVKVEEVCEEVLKDDCHTDPLNKTWKKFCDADATATLISDDTKQFKFEDIEEPRSQDNHVTNRFSVEDLIHESLAPVNNLVYETLKQIHVEDIKSSIPVIIPTEKSLEDSSEDIKGLVKILEKEEEEIKEEILAVKSVQSTPPTINVNIQFEQDKFDFPRASSSQVYFDPILNTLRHKTEEEKISSSSPIKSSNTSPQSLTEVLGLQLQSQFHPTTTQTLKTVTKNKPDSQVPEEANFNSQSQISSNLTPKPLEITTTTTTKSSTTTEIPTSSKEVKGVKSNKKLSAADFLRLCFTSHIGCDFSQNEIHNNIEPETDIERTPILIETTTKVPIETETQVKTQRRPKNIQERLKQRVKLCFFSGLCNDNDLELHTSKTRTTRTTTRTTTEKQTTTASSRAKEIQRKVQERARACFFEGKCN